MSTAGPNSPGTLADDAAVGAVAWSNPGNAASSNDAYAVFSTSGVQQAHYLKATNCGFSIPAGATIDGVTVSIERKAQHNSALRKVVDSVVRLVVGGTVSGDNKANTGTAWPTGDGSASYGGAADKWGLTPSAADVNGSDFGMVLSATSSGSNGTTSGSVDHITITVTYTEGGTQYTQTVSGAVTGAGGMVRQAGVQLAGSLTQAGALIRQTARTLAGSLTGSGALLRRVATQLAGSLTGAGALARSLVINVAVAGSLALTGTVATARRIVLTLLGSLTMGGGEE